MNPNTNVDGLLQQLADHGNQPAPPEVQEEFHQIAQSAPPQVLSQGLQDAFESDRTPPFAQMVGQLFGHANDQQKRGMLGTLLGGLGGAHPATSAVTATPEQAPQLSTGQVEQIAQQAQQANPGIVGQMSQFYAQHPVLVKSLGGMAMALVLGRMHSPRR